VADLWRADSPGYRPGGVVRRLLWPCDAPLGSPDGMSPIPAVGEDGNYGRLKPFRSLPLVANQQPVYENSPQIKEDRRLFRGEGEAKRRRGCSIVVIKSSSGDDHGDRRPGAPLSSGLIKSGRNRATDRLWGDSGATLPGASVPTSLRKSKRESTAHRWGPSGARVAGAAVSRTLDWDRTEDAGRVRHEGGATGLGTSAPPSWNEHQQLTCCKFTLDSLDAALEKFCQDQPTTTRKACRVRRTQSLREMRPDSPGTGFKCTTRLPSGPHAVEALHLEAAMKTVSNYRSGELWTQPTDFPDIVRDISGQL
jgi:hypothetical protein